MYTVTIADPATPENIATCTEPYDGQAVSALISNALAKGYTLAPDSAVGSAAITITSPDRITTITPADGYKLKLAMLALTAVIEDNRAARFYSSGPAV